MNDDIDLTAELDTAEAIVMGRAEKIETEWGVRYAPGKVGIYGTGPDKERWARMDADDGPLVRRTVTYGPWREVGNDSAPTAAVREDRQP